MCTYIYIIMDKKVITLSYKDVLNSPAYTGDELINFASMR